MDGKPSVTQSSCGNIVGVYKDRADCDRQIDVRYNLTLLQDTLN